MVSRIDGVTVYVTANFVLLIPGDPKRPCERINIIKRCLCDPRMGLRVTKWRSPKYRTLTVPVSMAQNIELLTLTLPGISIIFTGQKSQNTGQSG